MISIVGSGLTGLTCALELLKSNISVEIFEARQEVGNPIRSPGLLSNLDSKYIDITDAKKNEIGWGFRREWLEKTLAQEVLSKGGTIHLKQNISNLEGMVDCRGGKSISSGWPGKSNNEELVLWTGGLVIKSDVPDLFNIDQIQKDNLCFERNDGLVECWYRGENIPSPNQGWLELMKGEHPFNPEKISGDEAITKGINLATNIIQYGLEG